MPNIYDEDLAGSFDFHDKLRLCEYLDQDAQFLSKGSYIAKPNVSTEGLGYAAVTLAFGEDMVLQPFQRGEYLNVDIWKDKNGTLIQQVWTASRDGSRFHWFKYLPGYQLPRPILGKAVKLLNHPSKPTTVNAEFLGEYCIEAHARPSLELQYMPVIQTMYPDDQLYYIPIWRSITSSPVSMPKKTSTWAAELDILILQEDILLEQEEEWVNGRRRLGALTVTAPSDKEATEFSVRLNLSP